MLKQQKIMMGVRFTNEREGGGIQSRKCSHVFFLQTENILPALLRDY